MSPFSLSGAGGPPLHVLPFDRQEKQFIKKGTQAAEIHSGWRFPPG